MGGFRGIGVEFQIGLKTGPKFQFHSNHERGARPHRGGAGSARRGRRQQGYSRACFGRCYGLMRCPCLEGRAGRPCRSARARPGRGGAGSARRGRRPYSMELKMRTSQALPVWRCQLCCRSLSDTPCPWSGADCLSARPSVDDIGRVLSSFSEEDGGHYGPGFSDLFSSPS